VRAFYRRLWLQTIGSGLACTQQLDAGPVARVARGRVTTSTEQSGGAAAGGGGAGSGAVQAGVVRPICSRIQNCASGRRALLRLAFTARYRSRFVDRRAATIRPYVVVIPIRSLCLGRRGDVEAGQSGCRPRPSPYRQRSISPRPSALATARTATQRQISRAYVAAEADNTDTTSGQVDPTNSDQQPEPETVVVGVRSRQTGRARCDEFTKVRLVAEIICVVTRRRTRSIVSGWTDECLCFVSSTSVFLTFCRSLLHIGCIVTFGTADEQSSFLLAVLNVTIESTNCHFVLSVVMRCCRTFGRKETSRRN